MHLRSKGDLGEKIAETYLVKNNYKVIIRNWYCRWGEIDIIAKDKDCLVFVEVKMRTSGYYGRPDQAVHKRKLMSLKRSICRYLYIYNLYHVACRLDVITVTKNERKYKLQHYKSVMF